MFLVRRRSGVYGFYKHSPTFAVRYGALMADWEWPVPDGFESDPNISRVTIAAFAATVPFRNSFFHLDVGLHMLAAASRDIFVSSIAGMRDAIVHEADLLEQTTDLILRALEIGGGRSFLQSLLADCDELDFETIVGIDVHLSISVPDYVLQSPSLVSASAALLRIRHGTRRIKEFAIDSIAKLVLSEPEMVYRAHICNSLAIKFCDDADGLSDILRLSQADFMLDFVDFAIRDADRQCAQAYYAIRVHRWPEIPATFWPTWNLEGNGVGDIATDDYDFSNGLMLADMIKVS
jgi:hypothetical protein